MADFRRCTARLYPRDFHDALGGVYIDGHGHVYVRPALSVAQTRDLGAAIGDDYAWPFDVYTPAGEHLFSGSMARVSWLDARGDYVYYLSTNVETEERILVRAILREPF